jgi:hypothetical protein
MKSVNDRSAKVLDALVVGLVRDGQDRTVGMPGGTVLPVTVARLMENIYQVGHYFEQEGDRVADCEMTFLRGGDARWYPFEYRQDTMGIRQVSATGVESNGHSTGVFVRAQAEHAKFANLWLRNVRAQQAL